MLMTMMLTTAHTLSSKALVMRSLYGSYWIQEARKHVKRGQSQLISALSIKYSPGFQDPSMKKYKLSSLNINYLITIFILTTCFCVF